MVRKERSVEMKLGRGIHLKMENAKSKKASRFQWRNRTLTHLIPVEDRNKMRKQRNLKFIKNQAKEIKKLQARISAKKQNIQTMQKELLVSEIKNQVLTNMVRLSL
jgi:hypothetical protein